MPDMGALLSVQQIAQRAGWCCSAAKGRRRCRCHECLAGYRKMLRQLLAQNEQLGGMLMVDVTPKGPRRTWRITLEALRQLLPQWFVRSESHEDKVDALEQRVAVLTELVEIAHKDIGAMKRRLDGLEKRRAA